MAGKIVLDLGSGENERFASELKAELAKTGKTTTVISLNPDYTNNPGYREKIANIHGDLGDLSRTSIAAVAQRLPLRDSSVDEIFASYSLTAFAPPWQNPEGAEMWAKEIARVLKPGGHARLVPVTPRHFKVDGYDSLIQLWKNMGIDIEIHKVKTVDLLGEYDEWCGADGVIHKEKRDPEGSMFSTLILTKPF